MGTTDLTGGITGGIPWEGQSRDYVLYNRFTVPKAGVTNDVLHVLPVGAGQLVRKIMYKIVTAGVATTQSIDIGQSGTTAGWVSAFDATAAAATFGMSVPAGTYEAAGGAYFATAGYIDALLHTISVMTVGAVIDIWALCIDLTANKAGTNALINQGG